ncbi:MAG: aminoacyl-tRNA hydrolase, partial [Planctomycetia bacterium]
MHLVVGLGNPGDRYKSTRHNIGFRALDRLAEVNGAAAWQTRFDALVVDCLVENEKTLLVKPQTFMNASGRSVRKAIDFYKATPADLLVVCDDFSLPLGRLRLRAKGSSGGQNGLKDIIAHLGTEEFPRLRVGIGEPGGRDPAAFVLSEFSVAEKPAVEETLIEVVRAVECWRRVGLEAAMN